MHVKFQAKCVVSILSFFLCFLLCKTLALDTSHKSIPSLHSTDQNIYYTYNNLFHPNLISITTPHSSFQLNETLTNNSTLNTTNYGSCNPILFQLGDFSRDGPTLVYGICPDTYLTTAVSITFLLAYVIVIIVSGFGLYLRRDSAHVKARNVTYMLMTLLSNSGFIILTCLRFIIGRRIYPCSLYVLSFFIIPPGILLPSVFRLWRLYLMHKKLSNTKVEEISHVKTTGQTKETIPNTGTNSVPLTPRANNQSDITSSADTDLTDDVASYWIDNEEELKRTETRQKIFNILLSQKFIISTYIISFICHILLFIFFGSIEEGVYNQDTSKQRIFMGEGGFFVSSRGCIISNAITIMVAVEALFYIVIEFVFLILCFIIPRDTWYIKRETLLLVLLQFFTIIVFAVCGFIVQISKFTDFLIPFGFTLMTYSFTEVVVCVLMPVIYSVYSKKSENLEESELKQFLRNRKTFNILLDFARRRFVITILISFLYFLISYCPESVLCYNDIERFKLTGRRNRKTAALHITKTYLKPNSPLELNFPKLSQIYNEIMNSIENMPCPEPNLFESVQWQCLENMTDVFERLKTQSKEARKILQQWKADSVISFNLLPKEFNLVDSPSPSISSPSGVQLEKEQDEKLFNVSNIEVGNASISTMNIQSSEPNETKPPESPVDNLDYL